MLVRENETLELVCECAKAKLEITGELVEGMGNWRKEEAGDKLRRKLIGYLQEEPILDLCYYLREFEWLARKH